MVCIGILDKGVRFKGRDIVLDFVEHKKTYAPGFKTSSGAITL